MAAVGNRCSICVDRIKDHKLIPCNHSFCFNCLEDHVSATASHSNGKFSCPICEAIVLLPSKGLNAFKTNYYVQTDENEGHSRRRAFCIEHPDQDIRLVCQKCKLFMCVYCKPDRHDTHPSIPLVKAAAEAKENLKSKEKLCKKRLNDLSKLEEKINEDESTLNKTEEAEIEAIEKEYSDICNLLEQEFKKKKKKLKSAYAKIKKENADVKEKILDAFMPYSSAVQLIDNGSETELVEKGPELVERISRARSPPKNVRLNIPKQKLYRPPNDSDKSVDGLIGTIEEQKTRGNNFWAAAPGLLGIAALK